MACRTRSRTRLCVTEPGALSSNSSAKITFPILSQIFAVTLGLPNSTHAFLIRDVSCFIGRPTRLAGFASSGSGTSVITSPTGSLPARSATISVSPLGGIEGSLGGNRSSSSACYRSDSIKFSKRLPSRPAMRAASAACKLKS
jgi:hypothetical protein